MKTNIYLFLFTVEITNTFSNFDLEKTPSDSVWSLFYFFYIFIC